MKTPPFARQPGATQSLRVAIVYRRLSELKQFEKNPRLHSPRQIKQIQKSITTFGFIVTILVDANLKILAGHGRQLAAKALGWAEVPTICVDHLTDAQARAFVIADNRLTDNSQWDDILLAEQLKELSALDLDFSLEVTGFEMGEIDFLVEGLSPKPDVHSDPADDIQPAVALPQVAQVGDLWLLNQHRLYCGSALDASAVALLMGEERAAMVFTDPPYNVQINGHVSGLGKIHHREFPMACGELTRPQFIDFLTTACSVMARHSVDGSIHMVCMDWRHSAELLSAGAAIYSELKNICVWVKSNPGMGSQYRSQHEFVFIFKYGNAPHQNNIELGRFGRNRSNVWSYPGISNLGKAGEEGNLLALHPTVKPVALVADAILDSSARGEIVLDAFLGSGTTIIAAERTGRRCYGVELDPLYVDTIIRRWQTYTGGTAVNASSGEFYNALIGGAGHAV